MIQQRPERAGIERAEDIVATALPLYGAGSWRETHAGVFGSDAQLRWQVDQHRGELVAAGAIGSFRGRLFAFEPLFSELMLRFAREAVGHRSEARQATAQAAADAAAASREA